MREQAVTEGPFAGWLKWHARPAGRFVDGLGDVYYRRTDEGAETAIETGRQHSNGLGYLHGGFTMAMVDVALFATIRHLLVDQAAVTVQASTDFLGPGHVGQVLHARGSIVKEGGKLVWVAGTMFQRRAGSEQLVAQWHGLLRKVPRPRS